MTDIADLLAGTPQSTKLEFEDSEDLTQQEINSGHHTASVEHWVQIIGPLLVCQQCGKGRTVTGHKLRRKAPHLYACMAVSCNECLTDAQLVFRVDWLQESS